MKIRRYSMQKRGLAILDDILSKNEMLDFIDFNENIDLIFVL